VILPAEFYQLWLDPRTSPADLKSLLVPFPAAAMKSHPVGSNVNYSTLDDDALIKRVDFEPGTIPSLF